MEKSVGVQFSLSAPDMLGWRNWQAHQIQALAEKSMGIRLPLRAIRFYTVRTRNQVVRKQSAKLLCPGSNPGVSSKYAPLAQLEEYVSTEHKVGDSTSSRRARSPQPNWYRCPVGMKVITNNFTAGSNPAGLSYAVVDKLAKSLRPGRSGETRCEFKPRQPYQFSFY